MEPGAPLNVLALFKKPHKWPSSNLVGLRVEEHSRVHIAAVVGQKWLPMDDDPLFKSLAQDFADPEFSDVPSWCKGRFWRIFDDIWDARDASENGEDIQYQMFGIADTFLTLVGMNDLRCRLSIPFSLASLPIHGELTRIAAYSSHGDRDLPLAIFVGRKGPQGQPCSPQEIVPYHLFQAILKRERDPSMASFNTFVVSMKGTSLQFNKGVVPRGYVDDLIHHKVPSGSLTLLRSDPYNLLGQDDRRGFVRAMLGLMRNVCTECEGGTAGRSRASEVQSQPAKF